MADEPQKEETENHPRHARRYLLLFFAGMIILLVAAFLVVRPYNRLELLARSALSRHAPPGTSVGDTRVVFPLDIVLKNVRVPLEIQGRERELQFQYLRGDLSFLSLLRGQLQVNMNADVFGGTLWVEVSTDSFAGDGSSALSQVAFDARIRGLDIGRLGEFLDARYEVLGNCDADIEGTLNERDLSTVQGRVVAKGQNIYVPALDLDKAVLPENHDGDFLTTLSGKEGRIFIDKFSLDGTAYRMSGNGMVRISEPLERSPIDCSFSVVFREPPKIRDRRLSGMDAAYLMDILVESGAEVFFDLSGPANDPNVTLDPSSSLGSILRSGSR